jgi:hypothetical protein
MAPFHTPSDPGSDSLTFSSGEAVRLACPDANNNWLLIPNSPLTVYEVIAFCIKGEPHEFLLRGICLCFFIEVR